jgi:hypothetical protein
MEMPSPQPRAALSLLPFPHTERVITKRKCFFLFGWLSAGVPSIALFPPTNQGLESAVARRILCRPCAQALLAHRLIVVKPPISFTIWGGGLLFIQDGAGVVSLSFPWPSPSLSPVGYFVNHTLPESVVASARERGNSTFPQIAALAFRALSCVSNSLVSTHVSSSPCLSFSPDPGPGGSRST